MEEFYHRQQQRQQQPTWNSTIGDFNSYFTNCNDSFTGQPDPFVSAPTYLPVAPSEIGTGTDPTACQNGDSNAIVELIGRLGGNSNSNFHATSLNSQSDPTRNPNMGPPDQGFAERAARFSKFGSRSLYSEVGGGVGIGIECQIPRVSSCHALRFPTGSPVGEIKDGIPKCDTPENECSTVSDKLKQQNDSKKNSRKRKSKAQKEIGSLTQEDASDHDGNGAKRAKSNESDGNVNSGGSKNGKVTGIIEDDTKDYIHVRARRGQATDSHSLAERVRREKISQRMKFLQDLVPGCNKVTGKAVMLDEIINYVQSLQRQVEFLSMKLSTLNPKTDINMEALLSKDLDQARSLLSQSMFALASSSTSPTFPYRYQSQGHPMKNAHSDRSDVSFSVIPLDTEQRNQRVQFSTMDEFEQSASQVSMWIDELHNGVQMGYSQNER